MFFFSCFFLFCYFMLQNINTDLCICTHRCTKMLYTHCASDQGFNVSATSSESGINLREWDQSVWPFPCGNLHCSIAHYFDSERAAFPTVSCLDGWNITTASMFTLCTFVSWHSPIHTVTTHLPTPQFSRYIK